MLCLFFFSPPVLIGRFGLNPTFWLMNFSINATHFQLGILPSSLQIEAIIEKIKCSNNFKPLHTLQYYQCTSLFLKKGASSSGVLTIQAHRVYELIKHYQIIWNLYKSFGFPTLKANAVLNLEDARTWYAPNTRNTNILFEQRQSQALQMQQQKKKPASSWMRGELFLLRSQARRVGWSPARLQCWRTAARKAPSTSMLL